MTSGSPPSARRARRTAIQALERIDDGAYANLVLSGLLDRSDLDRRDRAFVTELVYGVTRMRRALDAQLEPLLRHTLDDETRRVLRLGAFQVLYLRVPPHAAVSSTVEIAPLRTKKLVNAVLRNLAHRGFGPWDTESDRLSFPDWVVARLVEDLGYEPAMAALEFMNEAPAVTERADGYVQDEASQWVADAVGAEQDMLVLDVCAAPGGKATAMAARGARVVAADVRRTRVGLIAENIASIRAHGSSSFERREPIIPMVADGGRSPFATYTFDRVLLDAPCSGLGVLHRRPDARWRRGKADLVGLAELQRRLILAALPLVKPGGVLVYSVCTLTNIEGPDHDEWMQREYPDWVALAAPPAPWSRVGRGARLLPQTARTDGMCLFRWRSPHS